MARKDRGVAAEKIKMVGKFPFPLIPDDSALRTHCYLCGLPNDKLEEEHVVPKVLFKGFDPEWYIKLMACPECNRAKGRDDEFVSRHLQAISTTPAAKKGFESALRSIEKRQGAGRDLLKSAEQVDLSTRSGIYLGKAGGFRIDHQRFDNFFTNIANGLCVRSSLALHDWKDYDQKVLFQQGIQNDALFRDPYIKELQMASRYGHYWEHIFTYYTDSTSEASFSSMVFYSSFIAVVFLIRKQS